MPVSKALEEIAGTPHWSNIDVADAVAALSLKQAGVDVVHIVNPRTKATVSVDLRDHTIHELEENLARQIESTTRRKGVKL